MSGKSMSAAAMLPRAAVMLAAVMLAVWITLGSASPTAAAPPGVRMQITAFSMGRYEPGKWGVVGIHAANGSDTDEEGLLAVYFGRQEHTQFARRIWVPARSIRRTWLPVRMPLEADTKQESAELTMLLLRETPQGEVLEYRDQLEMRRTSLLTVNREPINTAVILSRPIVDERGNVTDPDFDAYEVSAQAREMSGASRYMTDLRDELLPSHEVMWRNIDQLVLCSDRICEDTAGLAAVRDWLHRGGRLMVFLDRVSEETVAALVGHSLCYREIDRVPLDSFVLEGEPNASGYVPRDRRQFESAVDLVRVALLGSAQVPCRVGGWPAAFWQDVGEGKILFLALGASGWLPAPIPPSEADRPENVDADFRQTNVLKSLAELFYVRRRPPPESAMSLQPLLQNQIGYQIPSRSLATALLGLNCVALAGAGWWCGRRGRLDRLVWILPLAVVTTTAGFVLVGLRNSTRVPSTAAFTQFLQMYPDTGSASIRGTAALYQQVTRPLDISVAPDGFLEPLGPLPEGSVARLVWTDDDCGEWQNLKLAGGSVQTVAFQQVLPIGPPAEITARFGPDGLAGQASLGLPSPLTDAVIASPPAPPSAVQLHADGSFLCSRSDVLPFGEFLADKVLSDEEQRHQQIYRQLLDPTDDVNYPSVATLLGWCSPYENSVRWPAEMRRAGSAVAALPLRIERTAAATAFDVPATFIRIELGTGKTGRSMMYNPRTGRWVKAATGGTQSRLRFVLPQQVLPCLLDEATLTIKLNAPSRTLRLYAIVDQQDQLVEEMPNPNGVREIVIRRPEQLQLDAEGGVQFTIEISEAQQDREAREWLGGGSGTGGEKRRRGINAPMETDLISSFSTWQIDYVRLDVSGTTLDSVNP